MGIDMEEVSGKPPVKSLPRSSLTRQTPVSKHSPSARRARTSSTPNDGDEGIVLNLLSYNFKLFEGNI